MTTENPGVDTILFVDDEEIVSEPMCILLERSGYQVISVNNGKQAVKAVKQDGHQINLVILDMLMPGMDGLETLKGIREIQPNIPVLLASGYNYSAQMDGIKQRGCSGFIQKPFNFSKLLPMIQTILKETTPPSIG